LEAVSFLFGAALFGFAIRDFGLEGLDLFFPFPFGAIICATETQALD
jgi:hypothetical protein